MNGKKKDLNILIGKRLQNARVNAGYTQEMFAETLGVSVEHYRKLECGAYSLQPEKLLLLYEKYKIDLTGLIAGKKMEPFDLDGFIANCTREERDQLVRRMLVYIEKWITGSD